MQIAKFGGTSLAGPQAMMQVLEIVKGKLTEPADKTKAGTDAPAPMLILVLSAMGGVTTRLQNLAAISCDCFQDSRPVRTEKLAKELDPLRQNHLAAAQELLNEALYPEYVGIAEEIFANIQTILEAIALQNNLSDELLELLLPQGELLSSQLFTLYLKSNDIDSAWFDSRQFIVSKKHSDRTNVDLPLCRTNWAAARGKLRRVNVFPGFIASTPEGRTTVLGRNGSDYSATILAYGMEADLVEIWTDVDGILTTDPNIVPEASIIPEMSVEEAMEMAYFGAKVIHAQTLLPIITHPCPVRICNTFNPGEPGTMIRPKHDVIRRKRLLTAISYVDDASLLLLDGKFISSVKFLSRVFQSFDQHKIEPIMVIRVTADNKLCLTIYKDQITAAISAISDEFDRELHNGDFAPPEEEADISIISVIGEQMRGKVGTVGEIFSGLANLGVNILAIGQDITENNISFIIKQKDQADTICYLHQNYLNT
ncbi:aspartate kinase [Candidatus Haliotispira prima]|uniref:Aspartokinase n=1 Tax=Candidatus Haliotispira prima TaxID=3034016 RepID=A0ABY8MIJ2_9SPIO|nr:aspartate kinase [Candidatus Haliotispira prima]